MRQWWPELVLVGVLVARAAASEPVMHARIDNHLISYEVSRDLTFTRVETQDTSLYTPRALRQLDRSARTFFPDQQSLELVEAWVDQPDGSRAPVAKGSIFTRPSVASQSAPGFVNSQTTTVLFPQLRPGSHTHVVWRFTQKVRPLLGFNFEEANSFDWYTTWDEIRIVIPADAPLHWRARGGYVVTDNMDGGTRRVSAHIENTHSRQVEPAMTDSHDFLPLFAATSLPNAESIGATVYRASDGRAEVTPEIAALSKDVVGDLTGIDAARALHAWVARNIRYVAVYLNQEDGWVPHKAVDVLKTGYGDCKDFVVLMQALLAARGIEGQMGAVNWGSRYNDPLLWTPSFNHAILYLPQYDHYLNPTDRNARFDALDRRLSGKQVVLVTENGRVGRTPAANPESNQYRYAARVTFDRDGSVDGSAHFMMTANMEIPVRNRLSAATSMSDLAQQQLSSTPEGGFGILESSDPQDLLHPLTLFGTWHSAIAVIVQGRETFLQVPVGLDFYPPIQQRAKLSPAPRRHTPVLADVIDAGWRSEIAFPATLTVGSLPPDVDVETRVGRYSARYRLESGILLVSRNLLINDEVVQAELYSDLEHLIHATIVDARAVISLTHTGK